MAAVKRMTQKEFLTMPCGEVLEDFRVSLDIGERVYEWAVGTAETEGQLPRASAAAFAQWMDDDWANWTDEPEVLVQKILEGAVSDWCGGRTF